MILLVRHEDGSWQQDSLENFIEYVNEPQWEIIAKLTSVHDEYQLKEVMFFNFEEDAHEIIEPESDEFDELFDMGELQEFLEEMYAEFLEE